MAKKLSKVNRPWVAERKPFERANSNSEFYNSRVWRKARRRFLDKNPLCVVCYENDIVSVADVVDHIVPVNMGGEKLEESNFQSMCTSCHNAKSARENGRGMASDR